MCTFNNLALCLHVKSWQIQDVVCGFSADPVDIAECWIGHALACACTLLHTPASAMLPSSPFLSLSAAALQAPMAVMRRRTRARMPEVQGQKHVRPTPAQVDQGHRARALGGLRLGLVAVAASGRRRWQERQQRADR